MTRYAEFDVIKEGESESQTIWMVYAPKPKDAWVYRDGQTVDRDASFQVREVVLFAAGTPWLKFSCPDNGYHWHLGSADSGANEYWRPLLVRLPWVLHEVPRWRRIDAVLRFFPMHLLQSAAIKSKETTPSLVEWKKDGAKEVDNTELPILINRTAIEPGDIYLHLLKLGEKEGLPFEERAACLLWKKVNWDAPESWPLYRSELSEVISIRPGGFSPQIGRHVWTVNQTIQKQAEAFLDVWDGAVTDYHESIRKIRDGGRDSAVPARARSAGTNFKDTNGVLTYELHLPSYFFDLKFREWSGDPCLRLAGWEAMDPNGTDVENLLLLFRGISLASPTANPGSAQAVSKDSKLATIIEKAVLRGATGDLKERSADIACMELNGKIETRAAPDAPDAAPLPLTQGNCTIRDGALAFELADSWDSVGTNRVAGLIKLCVQDPVTGQPWWMDTSKKDARDQPVAFLDGALVSPIVEDFCIPVAVVEPGGQDEVPGDDYIAPHRAASLPASQLPSLAPVIIPIAIGQKNRQESANFVLICSEHSGWQRSAILELELHQLGAAKAEQGEVLVLDTAPFGVVRVRHEPLTIPNAEEMTLVARRSTGAVHGGSWELRDVDGDLEIMLPSQGLGEAMEKAMERRKPDGTTEVLDDIIEGELADFRLSPGARLTLAASYFAKRYVEPPWNTRRQFGWAGQRDPGAGIKKLEFELLYGLSCEVSKPWLRLADLLARVGALPRLPAEALAWKGTEEQKNMFDEWSRDQQALALAIRSRLGVLEVWDQRQPEGLKLKEGLEYFPRVEKKLNGAPTTDPPRGAQLRFPLLRHDIDDLDLQAIERDYHSADGLAGGFTWAFESGNIYKELWRNPRSSSAALEGLWFSALGGWGHQTARFAADKTVIESRISMGRTHFYVLERIGRIGVFWNKAKHVILYERVTGRARQFGDEIDGEGVFQDAHAGRPILRKVREYVEILEPERFYPDFPGDEAHHCGFVTGCVFRSKIMPVKSTWGRDVKAWGAPLSGANEVTREGWEIPLWQEGSDAITYPKPQIELEVITDPDAGDAGKMRVGLEQPQRLFFFTETTDGTTADVHAWNPFPWTDYCDLPEPAVLKSEEPVLSPDKPDDTLPDAEEELPGYERFTFKVVAGAPQASVTARRVTEAGMSATLRNVSMMRAVPGATRHLPDLATQEGQDWLLTPEGKSDIGKAWHAQFVIKEARTKLVDGKFGDEVRALLNDATAPTWRDVEETLKDKLAAAFPVAITAVQTLGTALEPSREELCKPDPAGLKKVGEWLWSHANHEAFLFHQFVIVQVIAPPFNKVITFLSEAEKLNSGARDKAIFEIEQARATVRKTWRGFQGVLDTGLQAPRDAARRFFDQCRSEFARLSSFPEAWIAEMESVARSAAADVATAKARIKDMLTAQSAAFTAFIAHLREVIVWAKGEAKKLADSASAQPPEWLDDIITGLADLEDHLNELELTSDDLFHAAEMAADKLDSEPQWLISELASLRDALRRERLVLLGVVAQMTSFWEASVDQWMTETVQMEVSGKTIGECERDISALVGKIDGTLGDVRAKIENAAVEWKTAISDARTALSDGRAALETELKTKLCDLLNSQALDVIKALEALLKKDLWPQEIDTIKDWFKDATTLAQSILDRVGSAGRLYAAVKVKDWSAARRELDQVLKDAGTEFRSAAGEVLAHSRKLYETADTAGALQQEASRTLRSVRALCDALTAPGLGFNRKTVALFYQARGTVIGMTPCVAKMREMGDQLQSLGLRLPTGEISERLKGLRDKLPQFNFGTILADLGLDFSDMFPGFKMPGDFDDYLKLSHDVDEQQMRAWARADLDYQIPDRKTLFSIGPIEVSLNRARVEGRASIEAELERPVKKSTWARMKGDWELTIGGSQLVTFLDAEVVMDNGRMDFKLKPEKIVMSGALKMLTDLTEGLSTLFADSGFSLGFVKEGEIPVGLRAILELPCFDAAGATSGVTGLQLGASFELRALDEDLRLNFSIGAGFHLGRKDKPFNVLIFILGGGGWVETDIYYRPKGNEIVVRVSIGLQVSASLALNLGVVRGAVGVYLGIFADYTKRTGQSGAMQIGIMLLIRGEVDVLGIVSVMLSLLLEVVYLSDGQKKSFYGRGTLSLEIRICWCFKIKVRKSVTYNFGGGGGGGGNAPHALPVENVAGALALSAGGGGAAPPLAPALTQRTDYKAAAEHYVNYLL